MAMLVDHFARRSSTMLEDLAALVEVESPSNDLDAVGSSARRLAELLVARTGVAAMLIDGPSGPHVSWRGSSAAPRVLLLGHHDTVHPMGSLAARPFTVADGVARGPGIFDMKAGIVQIIHALSAIDDPSDVEVLITSDEEVGSGSSRSLVEDRAVACGAVLVFEPSADGGAVKTGRKGNGTFTIRIIGRASHAGLEPERGVNALVEAAHQVVRIVELANPALGTTVTPTVAAAGTADNVVPALAEIRVDVRITQMSEAERVTEALRSLTPVLDEAGIEVLGAVTRPPMPESASASLFPLAQQAAADIGFPALRGVAVGGASDGNFTAAVGVPTLDGLGAIGGGAHAVTEHIVVDSMPHRTALTAALVRRVLGLGLD
jgi:glutamate carboxypeptidase